jgi:porphobilinogen synthase
MANQEKKIAMADFIAPRMSDSELGHMPNCSHRLHGTISHPLLKVWNVEAALHKENLLYPIFVLDVDGQKTEIKALPGQYRWSVDRLEELLDPLVKEGLSSVILFGVLTDDSRKDSTGSFGAHKDSPVVRALQLLSAKYPSLLLVCDVCLCAYTNHGHCGVIDEDKRIVNDTSIEHIAKIAAGYVAAGAHVIAPSDMMDGRIEAIKKRLKEVKLSHKAAVMSYAAKYASCFYGPFREAAGSGMQVVGFLVLDCSTASHILMHVVHSSPPPSLRSLATALGTNCRPVAAGSVCARSSATSTRALTS